MKIRPIIAFFGSIARTAALFAAASTFSTGIAVGGETLERFAGTFQGKGSVRRTSDDPLETVRCRINAELSENGLKLSQSGTCVVPGQKVEIDSELELNPANNRISGSWTDPATGGAASVSGRVEGSSLVLTVVGQDRQTQESRTVWMVLEPTTTGYQLTSTAPAARDGNKYLAGEIAFTK